MIKEINPQPVQIDPDGDIQMRIEQLTIDLSRNREVDTEILLEVLSKCWWKLFLHDCGFLIDTDEQLNADKFSEWLQKQTAEVQHRVLNYQWHKTEQHSVEIPLRESTLSDEEKRSLLKEMGLIDVVINDDMWVILAVQTK